MTARETAMHEYIAAVNEHDAARPESKARVRAALAGLRPHLVMGRLPDDLYALGKAKLHVLRGVK